MILNILLSSILLFPSLRSGWPVPIIEESDRGYFGGPKAYDVNGDGIKEILFSSGSSTYGGILYIFDINGNPASGSPIILSNPPEYFLTSPVFGDIDGDGHIEIVVASYLYGQGNGKIYAVNTNGSPVNGFPIAVPDEHYVVHPITLSRINSDDIPDILISFSHQPGSGQMDLIGIIDPLSGNFFDGWPVTVHSVNSQPLFWPNNKIAAYCLPLNGDSISVNTWDISGNSLPGWPQSLPGIPGLAQPRIVTFNSQDPLYHFVVPWHGEYPPNIAPYLTVYNFDGTQLPGFPLQFPQHRFDAPPSIADIDHDNKPEIIQDGFYTVYIINQDATYTSVYTDISQFGGEPAIADVDGDGQLEIVMGRSDYVENDSSIVCAFRLDGSQPEGWPLHVMGSPTGTPLIDDLDGDGYLEMVVFTIDLPWIRPDTGWLYLFDLPAPFDSAMVPWGQYAHDLWNSGIYGFNPPVSVAENPPLQIPSTYQIVYKNGIPFLTFTLSRPQKIYLALYDVSGRWVWGKFFDLPRGSHTIPLDLSAPPGIYIVNLQSMDNKTLKVIKLR